jgi:ElaB/YqjD/DUF883 family membrane-anchored ribosome-binding protein
MSKGILSPLFPATQQDVRRLQQSATDAVNDFSSAAAGHANKIGGQVHDLADHLREEGRSNFRRAQGKLVDLAETARDFATEKPLLCITVALAVGFLIGLSRARRPVANPEKD